MLHISGGFLCEKRGARNTANILAAYNTENILKNRIKYSLRGAQDTRAGSQGHYRKGKWGTHQMSSARNSKRNPEPNIRFF